MLNATIFTLFPEMFPGTLGYGIHGRALQQKLWGYETVNLRDFAPNQDGRIDDRPYGGGAGMVMCAPVIDDALSQYKDKITPAKTSQSASTNMSNLIYFSPRGSLLTSEMAREYAGYDNLYLLAGRYEGVDQRVLDKWQAQEICIGSYIVSGGELPAQVFLDAVIRFIPNVLGNPESLAEESFSDNMLTEYPHYTRPQDWQGRTVPEVLLNGNHAEIEKWRKLYSRD